MAAMRLPLQSLATFAIAATPAAPAGSITSPASRNRYRIAFRISSSLMSITSSTVPDMMRTASGIGTRTAIPSAIELLGASIGLCACHERAIEGAPSAHTAFAARIRHALAEVAGGRADEAVVLGSEAVQQVVGATTLERADWIGRLDLEHHCHTKPLAELFALVLRHVEEDGIDYGSGLTNSVDRDGGIHAGGLGQLDAPHPAGPPPTFPRGGELK